MQSHPNVSILQWSPDKKHSERERWICIYPAYINMAANLKVGVENKLYSRERSKELLYAWTYQVQLKNDDGTPCNPNFPTRDSIMYHLGEMIEIKVQAK
ncbi:hypothetical protein NQ317_002649 [Molorchus minor]|uniref:Signal recognition particle 19 kDa protein n=1 Tax=Molorchus minor TaxID=1323400 RepID=A0ABQ9IR97_9CUCU|nr:hypothetical protein NQ317_002649 [Molorchus minor]